MAFIDLSTLDSIERGDETGHTPRISSCVNCGLFAKCKTPKTSYTGNGKKRILIIGTPMTKHEDENENTHHNTDYQYLRRSLADVGIDIREDCWYTHAVKCYSKEEKHSPVTISACHQMLMKEVRSLKPAIIVPTCDIAMDVLLFDRLVGRASGTSYFDWCGEVIPDQALQCWVAPIFDPSWVRVEDQEYHNKYHPFWQKQLRNIDIYSREKFVYFPYEHRVKTTQDVEIATSWLRAALVWDILGLDYETTGLKPHRKGHKIAYLGISNGDVAYGFPFFSDKEFLIAYHDLMLAPMPKVAHNKSFERMWTSVKGGVEINNLKHDTMLAAHVEHNKKPVGLKFLSYAKFGWLGYDSDADQWLKPSKEEQKKYGANAINSIMKGPASKMCKYVALDPLFCVWLLDFYENNLHPVHQKPGYEFFCEAEEALSAATETGMLVDMEELEAKEPVYQARIDAAKDRVMKSPLILRQWDWSKAFSPSSDAHVRHLVYDILGAPITEVTDSGLASVDVDTLLTHKEVCDVIPDLLIYRKWEKVVGTYFGQFKAEAVDGVLKPFFKLSGVATMRSSSSNINFQNITKRDKETKKAIRSLLVPPRGMRIVEQDFKGAEVSAAAAITGDRSLMDYVSDPSKDMHRDLACSLLFLEPHQVNKNLRGDAVKGPWTFASWYGSYYKQTAAGVWLEINIPNAEERFGFDVVAHLKKNGIINYQDWEDHCKEQERVLWEDFFPGYQRWRKDKWEFFKKHGYVDYVNGFRYTGVSSRNSLLNAPIQGPAFHIQLWAFIQIDKELKKRKLRTRLCGQIHDSMIFLTAPEEEDYVDGLVLKYATEEVRKHWPWITVPLMVEKERSAIDGNWAEMEACGYLGESR